jgi:serine/threonine protein kinase
MLESLAGTVLDGRYELIELVGEGTFGFVYKARHQLMNRLVSVKLLKAEFFTNTDQLEHFKKTVKTLAAVSHPGIASIFDFGVAESGHPYLVTDFLPGGSLADWLTREERLPGRIALPMFVQVCDALSQAHKSGIIHADLKPANIMFLEPPSIATGVSQTKLVDFAIPNLLPQATMQGLTLTALAGGGSNQIYASPEQAKAQQLSGRSDVYSLGCIMYECLTGKKPLRKRLKNAVDELLPEQWEAACPEVKLPNTLQEIVFKALALSPEKRYNAASDLKNALVEVIAKNKSLQPLSVVSPVRHTTPGRKTLYLGVTLLASLAVAMLIIVCLLISETAGLAVQIALKEAMHIGSADIQSLKLRLANVYISENKLPEAQALLRQLNSSGDKNSDFYLQQIVTCLRLIEAKAKIGGPATSHQTAQALVNLKIEVCARKMEPDKLIPIFKEYLSTCQKLLGERDRNSIEALRLIAMEEVRRTNYKEAEDYLSKALAAGQKDGHETAETLHYLSIVYLHQGNLKQAEQSLEMEIAYREQMEPAGKVDKALILPISQLATMYVDEHDYKSAIPWLMREVDLRGRWRQFEYIPVTRLWAQLGDSFLYTGDIPAATKFYETAYTVMHDRGDQPSKNICIGLISSYLLSSKAKEAESLIEKNSNNRVTTTIDQLTAVAAELERHNQRNLADKLRKSIFSLKRPSPHNVASRVAGSQLSH